MNIFLRLKAWQIFVLTITFNILIFLTIVNFSIISANHTFAIILIYLDAFINITFWSLWTWAVGNRLNKKIKESIRPKPRLFNLLLKLLFAFFIVMMALSFVITFHDKASVFFFMLPFIIPVVICELYFRNFISRNLSICEVGTEEKACDYYDSFYSFYPFFFLAIWKIQPKINKIFEED